MARTKPRGRNKRKAHDIKDSGGESKPTASRGTEDHELSSDSRNAKKLRRSLLPENLSFESESHGYYTPGQDPTVDWSQSKVDKARGSNLIKYPPGSTPDEGHCGMTLRMFRETCKLSSMTDEPRIWLLRYLHRQDRVLMQECDFDAFAKEFGLPGYFQYNVWRLCWKIWLHRCNMQEKERLRAASLVTDRQSYHWAVGSECLLNDSYFENWDGEFASPVQMEIAGSNPKIAKLFRLSQIAIRTLDLSEGEIRDLCDIIRGLPNKDRSFMSLPAAESRPVMMRLYESSQTAAGDIDREEGEVSDLEASDGSSSLPDLPQGVSTEKEEVSDLEASDGSSSIPDILQGFSTKRRMTVHGHRSGAYRRA